MSDYENSRVHWVGNFGKGAVAGILSMVTMLAVCSTAIGQTFPSRPLTWVVPFAPGFTESFARLIGAEMEKPLGQKVIIELRPGAAGAIGAGAVAKAAPDGYTFLIAPPGPLVLLPYASANPLAYDAVKDLAPVGLAFSANTSLAALSNFPANNLADLVKLAKSQPGKLSYTHSGTGGMAHLSVELLQLQAGLDMVDVPYKGDGDGVPDFLSGRVPLSTSGYSTLAPYIKEGKVKMIVQFGAARSPAMPDVPTAIEAGYPDSSTGSWLGVNITAGSPQEAIAKLSNALIVALKNQTLKERMIAQGVVPIGSTPQQYAEFLRQERERWSAVIKKINLKL